MTERSSGGRTIWATAASAVARGRGDLLLGILDVALLFAAYALVLLLRFDGTVPEHYWNQFVQFLPLAAAVCVVSNRVCGVYGQIWRHASIEEAKQLLLAGSMTIATLLALELVTDRKVPLSVTLLGTGLGVFFMALVRFQSRLFSFRRNRDEAGLRIVVIGAYDAGSALIHDMQRTRRLGLVPVAVLDPDPRRHGRTISGVRVEGDIDDLPEVAARTNAHQAILAMSSVTPETVRQTVAAAEAAGIALKIVPGLAHRLNGESSPIHHMRDLRIDDLIGRKAVVTDLDAVRSMLNGRRVLITGAGGSIGAEIARQVARCEPASLIVVDHDESHLHDLLATLPSTPIPVLADIRERARIGQVFADHLPEIVFHAAAHKHVPLLEDHPCEAVRTNVLGTDNVLEAARAVGVERFVFVSTDKAVRPSSVMGATKQLGEQLTLSRAPDDSRYCAVRFGNVLGSRGSVVPTFMRQIAEGGPVTVTDPRMTRYFMTIEEAVQLVLQAAALAYGGEVFVLDMGEPVRIIDLAERMIRLSGRRVGIDIQISVTGIRAGEKLTEELAGPNEPHEPTIHPSISCVRPALSETDQLEGALLDLDRLAAELADPEIRAMLFRLVASHGAQSHPGSTGEDLVPTRNE